MFMKSAHSKILALALAGIVVTGCGGPEERKAKYLERGKSYLAERNFEKAAVEFKNVLQIDPKNAQAYFQIGRIEEQKRNFEKAFGYYNQAVELDPEFVEAKLSLARFYLLANNSKKANELVDSLLVKDPKSVDARLIRATILSRQGDEAAALKLAKPSSITKGWVT